MKNSVFMIVIIFLLLITITCDEDNQPSGPVTDISYSRDIQSRFDARCVRCHSTDSDSAGLKLDSWQNLIRGSDFGEVVIPFDPTNSLMIEMLTKLTDGPHPTELGSNTLNSQNVELLTRWISEGARNNDGTVPYEDSNNRLYVCNQDAAMISVIDAEAKLVIRNVDLQALGFSANSQPHHVAVEPNGEYWYVTLIGENKVLKFDKHNRLIAEAQVAIPALLAAHPTNGLLYVSRFPQAPGTVPQLIGVIDRATMQVLPDIPVRPAPHAMAVDHSGNFVYTCSLSESELVVINSVTNEAEEFIRLGLSKGPIQVVVSPDDETLYVSNQVSNDMSVIDVSDPSNRNLVTEIPVNAQPWHPIFTPDGSRVYVGNAAANTVTVLDTASNNVSIVGEGTGLDGISQPHGIGVSNDGQFVFIANRNSAGDYRPRHDFGDNALVGTVAVISTATNTIEKVIEVEEFASGMMIWEQ